MGRAHLSSRFGIDAPIRSPASAPAPQLPKYLDAPFDLDADVLEGPDVVYEAFLTPDEIRQREDTPSVSVARESAPSPVDSIESDESATTTNTEPVTRIPSPADRGQSPTSSVARSSSPGMNVLNLLEPLTNARSAALPALQAALAANTAEIGPLVGRLISILRPHIATALDPFRETMPDVEFLGHMFERSLILDMLPADHLSMVTFPRANVLAALDEAEGFMPQGIDREEATVGEAFESDSVGEDAVVDIVGEEEDADDAVSDPGMDEEDIIVEPYAETTERSTTGWWTGRDSSRVDWPHHRPTNRPAANASVIAPQIIGTRSSSRASTPSVMDVDTDDDSSSRSTSSGSSRRTSVYRSSNLSFAPRIVRAHGATTRPYPIVGSVAAGRGYTDRFIPVERLRAASPLR
ncbi:hypothetical protein FRB96_007309 [Tulasnella sp. 330]|nr:hypothetical protein FRB96_007309 [Tulasnella sp. 330]KAG8870162.1 hypothetical protein FRB98_001806 [Tulasnella sp. 332]